MKRNIFICVLLCFQWIIAQNQFQHSSRYLVSTHISDQDQKQVYTFHILNAEKDQKVMSTLTINDTELFEDIFVTTLENPGLKGVSEVIKVEVEYLACCAYVDAYYFLVNTSGEVIELPQVKNVYCQNADMDYQYIFPGQEYGIEANILKTQTFYTEQAKVKYVNLKQSYSWNGSTYDLSKTNAITSY
ncbi:hypothetical protein [Aquimarina brevivitae]|uniref:Uncharacterized protein n=1 Tax=Aquimarina brevivitae TaxID=323412 RepID=A0A4V2F7F8_9FLAO|nr:hypothetical protein [Aquimarina brevivitae]RZS99669.1 hypothetical protein EV197_0892 [Aquimarina brevivitae]